ncbi:MAG: MerR family transcriptional regulator [Burkholderiales bacterium]|nr:MerR family transcriptional regulator [Anaerolineae bacterium]
MYTVKQLSDMAGVSVRTLHYYDEIDLLHPAKIGANGYRYYDDHALLRLQQILFYREVGIELEQIKAILDSADFDLVDALRTHHSILQDKISRLQSLVGTVDSTIMHLVGEVEMSDKNLFEGFTKEKQEHYTRLARLQYGPETVNKSIQLWNSYGPVKQEAIREEGGEIYTELGRAIDAGLEPQSAEVQAILERWHDHLRYFYEPSLDILRGLGEGYRSTPDFVAFFSQIHTELPEFIAAAITTYVDDLETAEIERLLAADKRQSAIS